MCFSASVSFGAGAVLTAISVVSLREVKRAVELPFAAIPIIFAVQQFAEGILWQSLPDPSRRVVSEELTHLFLFFAQVLWPAWVPFAILAVETNTSRRMFLKALLGVGLAVSAYLGICLLSFPVQARIEGHHIAYAQQYPALLSCYGGVLYLVATIGPPLVSGVRGMPYLGLSILVSYLVSALFYGGFVISVWCFFSAVISFLVYAILRGFARSGEGYERLHNM